MMSIVCQVEGWVVRKGPFCEKCYGYEPGTEKDVPCAEPPVGCEAGRPVHPLGNDE